MDKTCFEIHLKEDTESCYHFTWCVTFRKRYYVGRQDDFLCYDFHDAFSGAKTYYRDDLAFPEISLEMVEKIELFKSNRRLILEEYMNDIEADFLVVDKKTIKNILSVFEKERKASVPGQYIITDIDSEKLSNAVNDKNEEISITSGHFYVVATFNNYPREFCCLLGELYTY